MSEVKIHATAIVDEKAKLGEGVEIGPYCIIGPDVSLGENTKLHSFVTMDGIVSMGKNCEVYQYTNIGNPPQDSSYKGEPTRVEIGDNNLFREFSSIHRGTLKEDGVTKIGNDNYFMSYVHIAHDCVIGNNVMFVNGVQLSGHVRVGDKARISGHSKVVQFCSIGKGAFIGGDSTIDKDIPCYCTAYGNRVKLKGINIIGLKRLGYDKEVVSGVVDFYRTMEASQFSPRAFINHPELIEEFKGNIIVEELIEFISNSEIGVAPFWFD
jgi:UDP-N-acetylglucosamine acyltransferase